MPFFHSIEIYLHYLGTIYRLKTKTETHKPNKILDNVKNKLPKLLAKHTS